MELRLAAREIFDETLRSIDPRVAVEKAVRLKGSTFSVADVDTNIAGRNVYAIALGKAAVGMAAALDQILADKFTNGIITSNIQPDSHELSSRWQYFAGGHPEPNDQSVAAARAAFDLLARASREGALLLFLVSGGGSAMIEWPVDETISLADLRSANRVLVNSGASISEINSVRRAFSAIKGGKLAARAPNCDQVTLIISDVMENQEWNVASGPTLPSPADAPDARDVVARYELSPHLPPTILSVIDHQTQVECNLIERREHLVLLSNRDALKAAAEAAQQRGFIAEIAWDISDQPIEEGCALLLKRIEDLGDKHRNTGKVVALISGGEFANRPSGDGIGGRNLETALRIGLLNSKADQNKFVALCAGTDGIDGNSPAAGAVVDGTTISRARAMGLDAEDYLHRSDSYSFFNTLDDAIITGPTGTNVRDIRILVSQC